MSVDSSFADYSMLRTHSQLWSFGNEITVVCIFCYEGEQTVGVLKNQYGSGEAYKRQGDPNTKLLTPSFLFLVAYIRVKMTKPGAMEHLTQQIQQPHIKTICLLLTVLYTITSIFQEEGLPMGQCIFWQFRYLFETSCRNPEKLLLFCFVFTFFNRKWKKLLFFS